MNSMVIVPIVLVTAGITFVIGYWFRLNQGKKSLAGAESQAKALIDKANQNSDTIVKAGELKVKDQLHTMRQEFEDKTRDRRQEVSQLEKRLHQREEMLDRKIDLMDRKEKDVSEKDRVIISREQVLKAKEEQVTGVLAREKEQLKTITRLSEEEAKKMLLSRLEQECRSECGHVIKQVEEETKREAQMVAKRILVETMQRCAAEQTVDSTTANVTLPNEDMKGRIIGREGRNIRAFEQTTGVDLIVDDTPDVVQLSSFDPIRREVAKQALEKLMSDGRIHPARIEEVVGKIRKEFDTHLIEIGDKIMQDFGIDKIDKELVRLMGRLRYRSSYGQNVLLHSRETGYLCGMLAAELGLDQQLAKRCGLLHDIGKAVSHEKEGPHAILGGELAKKFGEAPEVIHAIEAHHEDVPPTTLYAILTIVADSISGSRPGARGDTLENYVKRLQALEEICDAFGGVEKSYAIQAGREVRVIVQPEKITDLEAIALSREIKKKVERSVDFPGQIKITVVREIRAVEYAR